MVDPVLLLTPEDAASNTAVIKSVGRVFEILELFDHRRASLTAGDVALSLRYPISSTVAVLRSMATLGYLITDEGGRRYRPSLRLAILGEWIEASMPIPTRVGEIMQHLHRETGETITLAQQSALELQYVHILQGTHDVIFHSRQGTRRPLAHTAHGVVLMSTMGDEQVRALLGRIEASGGVRLDASALLAEIEQARVNGWAARYDSPTAGVGVIARLLPEGENAPQAISIGGFTQRIRANEARYVERLVDSIPLRPLVRPQ